MRHVATAVFAIQLATISPLLAQCEQSGQCFCDDEGKIGIAQLIRAVNIALGTAPCPTLAASPTATEAPPATPAPTSTALATSPPTPQGSTTPPATLTPSVSPSAVLSATPTSSMTPPEPTPTHTLPPDPCPAGSTDGTPVCGDGVCQVPEECDVGGICVGGSNELAACTQPADCPGGRCTVVGGQPTTSSNCAANCTFETIRTGIYAGTSSAAVQTLSFIIDFNLAGTESLRSGSPRSDDTVDINGDLTFRAGDIPVVTKPEDLRIDPAPVPGLVCACLRTHEVPAFGPGNSGSGLIACGEGLDGVDVHATQDHHTDPLENFTPDPECSLAADPECDDVFEIVPGAVSRACREQRDGECDAPQTNRHAGVCNSPRELSFSGSGAVGSAMIVRNISVSLLMDRGECNLSIAGMEPCRFADYGPDCVPCTDDDLARGAPEIIPATTGIARGTLYNSTNRARSFIVEGSSTSCDDNQDCTGTTCGIQETCIPLSPSEPEGPAVCGLRCGSLPCRTTAVGSPFGCGRLADAPTAGLGGGGLAQSFPVIDAPTIGDHVTSFDIAFE